MTVLGPVPAGQLGFMDAHAHTWIEPIPGAAPGAPVLDNRAACLAELSEYKQAGGGAMADCQPFGCGRNGRMLVDLSRSTGVHLVASTGFHLRRYYSPGFVLWCWPAEQACEFFSSELGVGLNETLNWIEPVQAGFIKVACETTLEQSPLDLLMGAAQASFQTGAAIEVHTEKGQDAEKILEFLVRHGAPPHKVILCHMDKRPDPALHKDLAGSGALLEYDTFFRPKYAPDEFLWPLIEEMVSTGYEGSIALAADLAEAGTWKVHGGEFGLPGLLTNVRPRLQRLGYSAQTITCLLGANIAQRLSR